MDGYLPYCLRCVEWIQLAQNRDRWRAVVNMVTKPWVLVLCNQLHTILKLKLNVCFSSQVYWLGDLNYRITELDPRVVKDYIDQGSYQPLLEYDQLHQQHGSKSVFVGYREGNITFRPTYKYDPGSDNWDSRYCNLYFQSFLILQHCGSHQGCFAVKHSL